MSLTGQVCSQAAGRQPLVGQGLPRGGDLASDEQHGEFKEGAQQMKEALKTPPVNYIDYMYTKTFFKSPGKT